MRFFWKKTGIDREAVLTHAFKIERQPEHPDVKEELNVMPVEDALMISENTEKRTLLLSQLQKDLTANYKIILAAEQDDDSESAHYVASAKMEIYRVLQQRWLECRREYDSLGEEYERLRKDAKKLQGEAAKDWERREYECSREYAEKYHAACAILIDMLDSEVLSAKEQHTCKKRFCEYVKKWTGIKEDEVSSAEYAEYLKCLVELGLEDEEPGLHEEAERLWQENADQIGSEDTYQTMLKMYYQTGERKKFEECLKSLCKNRRIHLSHEGLEQLRYWMRRLNGS